MKIIVIGGVAAGASFATRLRRLNEQAEIILFERGADISYASCALPYYLGGVITDRASLIERTPEQLLQKNNLDVRVNTLITAIDVVTKTVTAQADGRTYQESYDELILATGASPILPQIPGLTTNNAFTIRSVADADRIEAAIVATQPAHITLLGAGAAGVELAENFRHRGLAVTVIDQASHVLAPFDPDVAEQLDAQLRDHGVDLRLNTTVTTVDATGHDLTLSDDTHLQTDMLVVVTGVAPNSKLAKAAGITVLPNGHIPVDNQLQTNVAHVYAIGDVISTTSRITGRPVVSVLSSAANRQGHLLADIINGADLTYPGFIGASVVQLFDLTAANVGYTATTLAKNGLTDYDAVTITPFDHAYFFPNAQRITAKLLFVPSTGQILGGQFIGKSGVDKRAAELSAAISGGLTIHDLPGLELPYSPPYAASRDVLNVLGYVAINRAEALATTVAYAALSPEARAAGFFLDIREPGRPPIGTLPEDANIPLSQLRERLSELPQRPIYIRERKGLGPYNATRILAGHGFKVLVVTE